LAALERLWLYQESVYDAFQVGVGFKRAVSDVGLSTLYLFTANGRHFCGCTTHVSKELCVCRNLYAVG